MTVIEPRRGFRPQLVASQIEEWPYASVHDAILDGWQVVQFPYQQAVYDDREIDVIGYEFILQQMEVPS